MGVHALLAVMQLEKSLRGGGTLFLLSVQQGSNSPNAAL